MGKFQHILKNLRKSENLTQDELAQRLKISRSAVGMYENGSREPDYETLELIADFFNVDIDYLIGRSSKTTFIPRANAEGSHLTATETQIVTAYRQADDISKAMVLRALSIEEPAAETKKTKLA